MIQQQLSITLERTEMKQRFGPSELEKTLVEPWWLQYWALYLEIEGYTALFKCLLLNFLCTDDLIRQAIFK